MKREVSWRVPRTSLRESRVLVDGILVKTCLRNSSLFNWPPLSLCFLVESNKEVSSRELRILQEDPELTGSISLYSLIKTQKKTNLFQTTPPFTFWGVVWNLFGVFLWKSTMKSPPGISGSSGLFCSLYFLIKNNKEISSRELRLLRLHLHYIFALKSIRNSSLGIFGSSGLFCSL